MTSNVSSSRPPSSYFPLASPAESPPPRPPKSPRRPKSPAVSTFNSSPHYRPFSTLSISETNTLLDRPRPLSTKLTRRRPVSSSGFSMGFLNRSTKVALDPLSGTQTSRAPSPAPKKTKKKVTIQEEPSVIDEDHFDVNATPRPRPSRPTYNSSEANTPADKVAFPLGKGSGMTSPSKPSVLPVPLPTTFLLKENFAYEHNGSKIHPYRDEAVYPQSYDPVSLAKYVFTCHIYMSSIILTNLQ